MGTIQNAINSTIGEAAKVGTMAKGIKELEKSNTLKTAEAEASHIEAVDKINAEYAEAQKPLKAAKGELKEAETEFSEASRAVNEAFEANRGNDNMFPPRHFSDDQLEDLAGKAIIAKARMEEAREARKYQQTEFNKIKTSLQQRLNVANKKAEVFGITPAKLGGKK